MMISSFAFAQQKQLIVKVPPLNENNIITISRQMDCLPGVHFSGYASGVSCLLLRYDTSTVLDEIIITSTLHHLNKKLPLQIIRGITAYDVIDGKLPEGY